MLPPPPAVYARHVPHPQRPAAAPPTSLALPTCYQPRVAVAAVLQGTPLLLSCLPLLPLSPWCLATRPDAAHGAHLASAAPPDDPCHLRHRFY